MAGSFRSHSWAWTDMFSFHYLSGYMADNTKLASLPSVTLPAQIDPHGQVSVAAVRVEPITPERELHQRHMRGIHALQRDARGADIPAGFGDEVFQSLQNLLKDWSLDETCLKHCASFYGRREKSYLIPVMTQARLGFLLVFKCRNAVILDYQRVLAVARSNPKTVKEPQAYLSRLVFSRGSDCNCARFFWDFHKLAHSCLRHFLWRWTPPGKQAEVQPLNTRGRHFIRV